ncbi:MAG: DUF5777 family beta-barrel protein, partial [Elusimicrobiota bacterium]
KTFEVTAERFRFTPERIEVHEGDRVVITVRSADRTHGFAIKKLGIKHVVPRGGEPVTVSFVADRPGEFSVTCSEYCGSGHRKMKATLVVVPRDGLGGEPSRPDRASEAGRSRASFPHGYRLLTVSGGQESAGDEDQAQPGGAETHGQHGEDEEAGADEDEEAEDLAQPDFTVVTLPTTLRLPRFKSAFRVTHRFTRPLGEGELGDLAADLFGLDGGAQIGLEYRFGLRRGLQVGVHRTSDRTIELFGQLGVVRQAPDRPFGLDVAASVEGLNNFKQQYSPAVGLALSRSWHERLSLHLLPLWIGNTELEDRDAEESDHTVLLGLGTRLRVGSSAYLVGQWLPRLHGFAPGEAGTAFGIEKQVGGHVFQLNVSNALGTTAAQLARGAFTNDQWFLGFNISRKFY